MPNKTLARVVVPFSIKANVDPKSRTFEGLAATWDLDLGNDIIQKGAFKKTIGDWKKSGDALPLLNSHDHFDIMSALGQLIDAKETTDGLWTKWEVMDGPEGDAVLNRLRASPTTGRPLISKMSIGFNPTKFSFEQPEGTDSFWDRIRHIQEADLKEVSLVLFPMQPGASIDASSVKAFLLDTKNVDPSKLDINTKLQLRKLASRIGILLKKQEPNPAKKEADDPALDPALTDDTDTPDEDEDTDESDDLDDTADDESTDDTDGDEDEDSDESDDEEKSGTKPKDKKKKVEDKKTEDIPTVYPFQEALAQRLKKVSLHSKISDMAERRS